MNEDDAYDAWVDERIVNREPWKLGQLCAWLETPRGGRSSVQMANTMEELLAAIAVLLPRMNLPRLAATPGQRLIVTRGVRQMPFCSLLVDWKSGKLGVRP